MKQFKGGCRAGCIFTVITNSKPLLRRGKNVMFVLDPEHKEQITCYEV